MTVLKLNGFKRVIPTLYTKYFYSTAHVSVAEIELKNAKPFEEIPGPRSFLDVIKIMALPNSRYYKKPLNELLKLLREDYGNLCHFPGFLGSKPIIFTYLPEDAEKVFRQEGKYPYRRGFESFEYYRKKHRPEFFKSGGGLTVEHGHTWYEFRTKVNQIMMQPKNVKMYIPGIDDVAKDFVQKIRDIRDEKMVVPDNFLESLNEWSLESIALIALDTRLNLFKGENSEARKLYELIKGVFQFTFDYDVQPSIWRYYKTPKYLEGMKNLDEVNRIIFGYVGKAIEKYDKNPSSSNCEGILEKLLKVDRNVAEVMAVDMLGAGIDTTSSSAAAVLCCLAKNPDKQERLREEIKSILPSRGVRMTEKSLDSIPYMRAVLKEAMRVYPIFAGNSRAIDHDIVLQGYRIPKGMDIMLVQTSNTDFEEPDKFIPERWLKNTTEKCPHSKEIHPFSHLPFGNGPRMCIGRRMAEMEIEILLTRLLSEFKLEWVGGDLKWNSSSINVPSSPLKLKISDL